MPFDAHEKARRLIDQSLTEQIGPEDEGWLLEHNAGCADCVQYAELSQRVVRGLHGFSFEMDEGVAGRVQAAATAHAQRVWSGGLRNSGAVWLTVAAAALLLAVPVYQRWKARPVVDAADAALMERVEDRVSREVPRALEPLLQPSAVAKGADQ